MQRIIAAYRAWRFRNTTLLFASFVAVFLLAGTPWATAALRGLGEFGYIGAFVAGILFVSTFTVAVAGIVLFYLAQELNPLGVALVAGGGAMMGDLFIFRYFKDYVFEELRPVFRRLGDHPLLRIMGTPYFAWMLPVIGALIIASPFPDEIGIGLMGISRMKNWQFLLLAFVLNSAGIFFVVTLARSL